MLLPAMHESKLRKWLTPPVRKYEQLDYILVSNRWKSSITDCRARWGPSIHRSKWGIREDHALVSCKWKWRLRDMRLPGRMDFSALAIAPSVATKFNTEFKKQIAKLHQSNTSTRKEALILYDRNGEPFEVPEGYTALDDFMDSEDEDFNPFEKPGTIKIDSPSLGIAMFMAKMTGTKVNIMSCM